MEQKRLFEPLQLTQKTVRLDEIGPWTNDGASSPILASISALGMLDPVTVQALPPGQAYRYKVRAGKRRLTSCLDLGLETVPAVVLPVDIGEVEAALVPLAENILRRENPLHEAREIRGFFDACRTSGMPEAEIRPYLTGLGVPAAVIDSRLKLLTLPPEIQQGITEGKVKPSVATKVANRSKEDQQAYVQRLQDAGKLTGKDVTDLRKVQVQSTLENLPDALFELTEDDPAMRVRRALEAFVAEGVSQETLRVLVEELAEPEATFLGT
jgi:ParB/RepB/Spo0J family partition protein